MCGAALVTLMGAGLKVAEAWRTCGDGVGSRGEVGEGEPSAKCGGGDVESVVRWCGGMESGDGVIEHCAGRIADDARDFASWEGGLGYYRCNANRKDEGQAA